MSKYILETNKLVKNYGIVPALKGIDLQVPKNAIVGLLGPNGSGKTTLIKLINGLLTPTSGSLLVDGLNIGPDTKEMISYLPDSDYFADWMKVKDIFDLFKDFYISFNYEKALKMASDLSIPLEQKIKNMSKGTREKLQLILVMSREAKLYVLDEPIAGVDPAARDYILDTILTNQYQDSTIIISTHLISDIEKILDNVIFIKNGEIVRQDSVENIVEQENMSIDEVFRKDFKHLSHGGNL